MSEEDHEPQQSALVVIGASAGGIESLSSVVSALPGDFAAPVVIALHLSPDRKSSLATILERRGRLPVRTLEQRTSLEPGVVYVVPPDWNVRIGEHEATLERDGEGAHPSIDLMFRSAAGAYGENLIAVVLSGTGSDGALGSREVKSAGGTVIIENPDDAAFPGMPLSLSPTDVDVTADLDRIGELLAELISGDYEVPKVSEAAQLRALLEELRDEVGVDFATYRQGTIQRRIQRRMVATDQPGFDDYLRYIRQNPDERQRLAKSFLINVTKFFRDTEMFDYLREQVLPELLREAETRNRELRIWSAGCSTGEEAYSLAIIVDQLLRQMDKEIGVRIFATDLDEDAVAFARRGVFSARALEELPEELVKRYFLPIGDEFEVRKQIRSMLVFGEHDLSRRAPFPRIDLVLCRNVLIYFTPPLQRRALELFGFSLRNGGYLVLGKSETVNPLGEHFAIDQARLKVFRRIGDRGQVLRPQVQDAMALPPIRSLTPRSSVLGSMPRATRGHAGPPLHRSTWDREQVLYALPYGLVVVDRSYDIQYINSEARDLFGIFTTAIDQDLIHLIQRYDPMEIRRTIDAAMRDETVTKAVLSSSDAVGDALQIIEVMATPIAEGEGYRNHVALTVLDVTERERVRKRLATAEEASARLAEANDEVLSANHRLAQSLNRLRSDNEQMQVASAEIQAATEEVETLNEELQASNEELETLNEELQATVEELNTTNDDLEARSLELHAMALDAESARQQLRGILDAVDGGIIVVDGNGETVLVSEEFGEVFGTRLDADALLHADGTPIEPDLSPVARAGRGETFSMTFTMASAGSPAPRYEAIGRPVSISGSRRLGVITVRPCPGSEATSG